MRATDSKVVQETVELSRACVYGASLNSLVAVCSLEVALTPEG